MKLKKRIQMFSIFYSRFLMMEDLLITREGWKILKTQSLLRQTIRPEFLNRIDDVIMFQPLMLKEIKDIVRIQLNDLKKQLLKNGVVLEFSNYALDYLAENGFDPQFGARPLKRLIQKQIINQLSKKLLSGTIDKSHPVLVDVFDKTVVFRNEITSPKVVTV